MSRLLIDPAMPTGPKFAAASDTAKLLHFLGLCYAAHAVTDGFVPEAVARKLTSSTRRQFDQAIAHLTSVQPGCENPSWESRPGGWFIHDYDDPLYGNPMREDSEKRREQKVKAGAEGGKKSALARLRKYGTAQPPGSNPEAPPEAPASKHPEATASSPASKGALSKQTEAPRSTTPPRVGARAHVRVAQRAALPFPSSPDPSVTPDIPGEKELSSGRGDDAVLVANGSTPSPQIRVLRLLDWFMARRGWSTWSSADTQKREATQAIRIIELGLPLPEVLTKLDAWWSESDPDDRPSSLEYFWTRLQDEQHQRLKQEGRSHVRTEGFAKVHPSAAAAKRK